MNAVRQSESILPLHVEGLTFEREGKRLLDHISFVLPKGGITAVIGPNGAGKSLTLRLCHGLLEPTAGTVSWREAHHRRKPHGMVFQRPVMLRRSVRANIDHAIRAHGGSARSADAALKRFGLSDLAARPARILSGGEQQRLALARAWALEPEVLFLDEPTSALDPGAARMIEEIIASLSAEGVTILLTTHDLAQARRLARRVLFFNRGRLVEDAAAPDFFAGPKTPEASAFLTGDLFW